MLASVQNALTKGSKYYDVIMAVIVVLILSLMILPVPPWLLDILLAVNLSISMLLLMLSMYVPHILEFSTFPSMLLVTTLFRLSLNITTTRLILLEAHAGDIIFTFGNFVVGGNFIVGVVIFLIITIVQFVVITKGAERVAEVAARFTLDAMPGKQMSIDADLRAGNITQEDAKKRRSMIEKESQLHGSMDGAMKFVKGDAIAGLIITAINITAGIAIGTLQKGWEIGKAVTTYSILTIGDGLVSQIPALLISITAGMIVTRVGNEEEGGALGGDVGKQLLSQPKALMIAAGFLFAFALIPGFPKIPFIILGGIAGAIGYANFQTQLTPAVVQHDKRNLPAAAASGAKPAIKQKRDDGDEFSVTVPLLMDVSAASQEVVDANAMNDELIRVRKALYHDLGVPFPGIHLRFNESLPAGQYKILLHEVPIAEGMFQAKCVLAREKPDSLRMLGIEFTEEKPFVRGLLPLWVPEARVKDLEKARVPYLAPTQVLTYHLSIILKRYAGDFVGLQETKYLLEQMEAQFPEVVREVQRVLPVQKITEVFQRLVQEEVSIRNLRTILQALIEWGQKEKEAVLLTEYVRASLKRYISYKFSRGQNILAVYLLEPSLEEKIRKAVRQTSAGAYLALEPMTVKALLTSVRREVGDILETNQRPVLLTSLDVRRYTRKLIEQEFYELPVLSHQELTEEITIQPLGRIAA
ncbi:type III secretion system export apparatus subunit SctV [Prosthecobacter dejongeii]|uniref:Type III secretion protein V n=1 Tax=Prosthecobacter dejongeii TaxID=48465 RepID=A0A7W7YK69_9BACT|nr:type III secretion system export apparatus subunit SctV [Prosthecobacter dejongeii]MBB5037718.1 type III secretion protein V [Prosthecobacter dejongeii]